jgi:hypothetical protein
MAPAVPMMWNGETILVESDTTIDVPVVAAQLDVPTGFEQVSSASVPMPNFERVLGFISSCSEAFHDALEQIPGPEEATIEFGVKLAGEAGLPVLTKVSSEATIKVTLKWKTNGAK